MAARSASALQGVAAGTALVPRSRRPHPLRSFPFPPPDTSSTFQRVATGIAVRKATPRWRPRPGLTTRRGRLAGQPRHVPCVWSSALRLSCWALGHCRAVGNDWQPPCRIQRSPHPGYVPSMDGNALTTGNPRWFVHRVCTPWWWRRGKRWCQFSRWRPVPQRICRRPAAAGARSRLVGRRRSVGRQLSQIVDKPCLSTDSATQRIPLLFWMPRFSVRPRPNPATISDGLGIPRFAEGNSTPCA
jgi:hypothetical protein